MSWSKKPSIPRIFKVGDEVDVVVLDIKPSDRRVSLGIKQALPDPWLLVADKYPVGTIVTGKIRNIAEFGAFVEIEEGFDGLVHVGDVSWTERIKNPHEVFKKGEPVTAKVLKIDPENRRVSLGIKQVNDIWGEWFKQHKVGQIVKGKVSRIATFGAFVELGDNIEALCHNTEIEERKRRDEGHSPMHRTSTGPLKSAGPLETGQRVRFQNHQDQPGDAPHRLKLPRRRQANRAQGNRTVPLHVHVEVFFDGDDWRRAQVQAVGTVSSLDSRGHSHTKSFLVTNRSALPRALRRQSTRGSTISFTCGSI